MALHDPLFDMLRCAKQGAQSRLATWRMRRGIQRFLPESVDERRSRVVIDVGANVGQTALMVERALRGAASSVIHCFEPFAENYAALQANVAGHPAVRCHRMAMGAAAATIAVPLAPESQWHSIANQERWRANSLASETIEMTSLDAFAEREGIDRVAILKTDTEGYDLEVLRGGGGLLAGRRIDLVICEVGFNPEDRQHTFFPGVFDLLLRHGYRLCRIDDQMVYRGAEWGDVQSIGYANAWFVAPSGVAG